jgi:hypothetical protein
MRPSATRFGKRYRGTRDVVLVLAENHAILHWLSERLAGASTPAHRQHLFDEFAKALGGHLRAVDEAILPALRQCGWRDVSSAVLVGHSHLKHQLAVLLVLKARPGDFDRALFAFFPRLADQQHREAVQIVPVLRKLLDAEARAALGVQVTAHFSLMFDADAAHQWSSEPAHDLVDEARIVFGSFPGPTVH